MAGDQSYERDKEKSSPGRVSGADKLAAEGGEHFLDVLWCWSVSTLRIKPAPS